MDKDQYQIMEILQAEGIPAGPLIHQIDTFYDHHLNEREFFVPVEHPECGTHHYPGPLCKLSETPTRMGPAPLLGQHNDYVYRELLGYSEEEIQHFIDEEHYGDAYLRDIRVTAR